MLVKGAQPVNTWKGFRHSFNTGFGEVITTFRKGIISKAARRCWLKRDSGKWLEMKGKRLILLTSSGSVIDPWTPSSEEMFATDWVEIFDKVKTDE